MSGATSAAGVEGVGQIAVRVQDVERAVAFYRDTLGIPLLFQIPNAAFLQCGGLRLMLALPETPEVDHPASILYYRVPDLHAATAVLRERGATLEGEPRLIARMPDHELWMTFFRDSEGNLAALMSEVG